MKLGLNIQNINLINELDVNAIINRKYKYVTFDLFDTLIYRKFINHTDVVNLTNIFFASSDKYKFNEFDELTLRRQHITNIVRDSSYLGTREPLLADVLELTYASIGKGHGYGAKAEEFEFNLEFRNLYLIPGVYKKLSQLKDAGIKLALISDMYFEKYRIEALLEKFDIGKFFDGRVFVSSDLKLTKHEGDIYPLVLTDLNVKPSDVLHIGDNINSDIKMASKAGIDSVFITSVYKAPTEYEELPVKQKIISVFSNIMATHLLASLTEARRLSVDNCFFLSRDGDILHRIWMRVLDRQPTLKAYYGSIKTDILAINRHRGLLLELRILDDEQFLEELVCQTTMLGGGAASVTGLCTSLGILTPPECIEQKLKAPDLIKVLKENNLLPALKEAVIKKREETMIYLKNKNVIGAKSLFSDVGYSGTVMRNIIYHIQREITYECENTKIYSLLVATNVNYHANNFFSEPFGQVFKGSIFDYSNIPEIMTDNFSWLEWAFKNWSKGTLIGYDFNSNEAVGIFKLSEQQAPDILEKIENAAVALLINHPCPESLISKNHISLLRERCIDLFQRPSKEVLYELEKLTHDRSGLSVESGKLFEKESTFKAVTGMRKWKNGDVWISGSLMASGAGFMIPLYPLIKRGFRVLAKIRGKSKKILKLVR